MSILRKQVEAHNIPQMQCGPMQMLPLCGFSRKPLEKILIQEVDQNSKVKNQQISFPTLFCEGGSKAGKQTKRTFVSVRKLFRAFTIKNDFCGNASNIAMACACATTSLSFSS